MLTLDCKRKVGISEYGAGEGKPVLYFHGFPGSRLEAENFDARAQDVACRLIGIDRPGMGLSEFNKEGSLLSWASDVDEITDKLGISSFSIIAHSGGVPFAAACASQLKSKVSSAAFVSGMAPCDHGNFKKGMPFPQKLVSFLLSNIPALTGPMMKATHKLLLNPKEMQKQLKKQLPDEDYALFENEAIKKQIVKATLEAFNQGINGPAYEMKLLFKPWGFKLSDIQCPVSIWYGESDKQAPISHAHVYSTSIKNSKLNVIKGQGHHSLIRNYFAEIIEGLLSTTA